MIHILLPDNNLAERRYAAEVLLTDWLGLPIKIESGQTIFAAEIILENGNRLRFEDHFFHRFKEDDNYLETANIPVNIAWTTKDENPFISENNLPILFGNKKLDISPDTITCGIDLFAAAFFMLTRWEEYVLPDRDAHERFPAEASVAAKQGFLQCPIVNEMVEMLWSMLRHLGISHPRKRRKFELLLTHDVDAALLWRSGGFFCKKLGGDLLKRRNLREALFSIRSYWQTRVQGKNDPYDTFGYLMQCADRQGLQAQFYILCGGDSPYDNPLPPDAPFMRQMLQKIQEGGHIIGIHPSYNTLKNSELMTTEVKNLEQATGFPLRFGRQHFLRFEAPFTWQWYEDLGLKWDSSLYYSSQPGFRCGACQPFPVFNFLTRKKLRLQEIPLTAMDVTWTSYLAATPEKMWADMSGLLETVRKYQGTFVLLWHNSSFNTPAWEGYRWVFEKVIAPS
jgi:hypothetical protein